MEAPLVSDQAVFLLESETAPKLADVSQQLQDCEKRALKVRQSIALTDLLGSWRLMFVLRPVKKSKRGFLKPLAQKRQEKLMPSWISIQISFWQDTSEGEENSAEFTSDEAASLAVETSTQIQSKPRGQVENCVQLGPISLTLSGPFCYHPQRNLLAFDFLQAVLKLQERSLLSFPIRGGAAAIEQFWDQPLKDQAFFRYFLATSEAIAARGRGGGIALWYRSKQVG